MPVLFLHTINSTFDVRDDGAQYNDVEAARERAIEAVCEIAAEEIKGGVSNATVRAFIETADKQQLAGVEVNMSLTELARH